MIIIVTILVAVIVLVMMMKETLLLPTPSSSPLSSCAHSVTFASPYTYTQTCAQDLAGVTWSSSSAFPSYISGVHHFLGEIFAYVTVF